MEIVINIPEWKYKSICKSVEASKKLDFSIPTVFEAVANGKVLPKGHGRLIDADAVLEEPIGDTYKDIDIAETIIEAESGGGE